MIRLPDRYRRNWPRVGGVIATGAAGTLAITHRRFSKPRLLSALNLLALLAHQYEEYEDPGYFPGQFNGGMFHSDQPDRYPLARAYTIAFAAGSIAVPNVVLRDKNSPYKFTAKQLGRHANPA